MIELLSELEFEATVEAKELRLEGGGGILFVLAGGGGGGSLIVVFD